MLDMDRDHFARVYAAFERITDEISAEDILASGAGLGAAQVIHDSLPECGRAGGNNVSDREWWAVVINLLRNAWMSSDREHRVDTVCSLCRNLESLATSMGVKANRLATFNEHG